MINVNGYEVGQPAVEPTLSVVAPAEADVVSVVAIAVDE
jgi:hypothetical protein